jgi:hypothetical protein
MADRQEKAVAVRGAANPGLAPENSGASRADNDPPKRYRDAHNHAAASIREAANSEVANGE